MKPVVRPTPGKKPAAKSPLLKPERPSVGQIVAQSGQRSRSYSKGK